MTDAPPTVWVVHFIGHDDNGVEAVFADREHADAHADALNIEGTETARDYFVSGHPVLDRAPERVVWHQAHNLINCDDTVNHNRGDRSRPEWTYWKDADPDVTVKHEPHGFTNVHAWATSEAAAAEACERATTAELERRAQERQGADA